MESDSTVRVGETVVRPHIHSLLQVCDVNCPSSTSIWAGLLAGVVIAPSILVIYVMIASIYIYLVAHYIRSRYCALCLCYIYKYVKMHHPDTNIFFFLLSAVSQHMHAAILNKDTATKAKDAKTKAGKRELSILSRIRCVCRGGVTYQLCVGDGVTYQLCVGVGLRIRCV